MRSPPNAGSVKRRGEDSIPRKGKVGLKGSEAAEGEGAAKMASASSGPAAAGFSSLDSGVPASTAGESGRARAVCWGGLTVRWELERVLGKDL